MLNYTKSAEMLADSLTKALLNDAFDRFVRQLGLADISEQLDQRRRLEREAEDPAVPAATGYVDMEDVMDLDDDEGPH